MNIDGALRDVSRSRGFALAAELQTRDDWGDNTREALAWALDSWEESSAQFVNSFAAFSTRPDRAAEAPAKLFYSLHLCAEKKERAVFAPLCRMIIGDPLIARWLGDGVTETLPGVLIRLFDGDVGLLQAAIESPLGDPFARASALAAYGYLVRAKNVATDVEARAYLQNLLREMKPRRESVVWMAWAACAANLGYVEFLSDVMRLNDDTLIPEGGFPPELFEERVASVRADRSGLAGFHADLVRPLRSAIEAVERLSRLGGRAPESGRRRRRA